MAEAALKNHFLFNLAVFLLIDAAYIFPTWFDVSIFVLAYFFFSTVSACCSSVRDYLKNVIEHIVALNQNA